MPKKRRPLTAAQRERKEAREIERALDVIDKNVKAREKRQKAEHALLDRIDSRLKVAAGTRRVKRKAKKKKPAKRKTKKRATKRTVAKKSRRKTQRRKAPARKRKGPWQKGPSVELARKKRDAARARYNFAKSPGAKLKARDALERALIAYGDARRRAGFE